MPKLTVRHIAALQPREKSYQEWDSEVRGLWIKCQPSGYKSIGFDYRFPSGRQGRKRHFTLGAVGTLSLDDARILARQYLLAIRHEGIDPLEHRQLLQGLPTVAQLAERYLQEHARPKKKPRSVAEDERHLRTVVLPALGEKPVHQVTRQDVARVHHHLRATPTTANRVLSLLSMMFTLAEAWGLREQRTNPVYGLQRYRERKVERFLSGDELRRLGDALTEAEHLRTALPGTIACIRLLLLTGARLGEVLGLTWSMVDLERGMARLPDSKTGAKTLRLPGPALEILRTLPRTSVYVLQGRHGGPLSPPHHAWKRLCVAAGIAQCRLHDLRHSYASIGVMSGLSLPMVGRLLGHSTPSMTARYAHLADDPVALASEQIAARVRQAMGEG